MSEPDKRPMVKMMPAWAAEAQQLIDKLLDTEDTNLKAMYRKRLEQLLQTQGRQG